jgi:hypothetical protein
MKKPNVSKWTHSLLSEQVEAQFVFFVFFIFRKKVTVSSSLCVEVFVCR